MTGNGGEATSPAAVRARAVEGQMTDDERFSLLVSVLKGAWGYPGWVMSDWGGTTGWEAALEGLDQESGLQLDMIMWQKEWFTAPLRQAYADGKVPEERLSGMVRRILGFQRVELPPGESRQITITADRRLLARFDGPDGVTGNWRIARGTHQIAVGRSAQDLALTGETQMPGS